MLPWEMETQTDRVACIPGRIVDFQCHALHAFFELAAIGPKIATGGSTYPCRSTLYAYKRGVASYTPTNSRCSRATHCYLLMQYIFPA